MKNKRVWSAKWAFRTENPRGVTAGSLFLMVVKEKAKGEEKPEEELMGKRKSSPRLATAPHQMLL
ncbi:hypothetical protein ACEQPO_12085 [Bacillus sp. SL00103]